MSKVTTASPSPAFFPSEPQPVRYVRGKTDHAVALAYAARGWGLHDCRDSWEESLRYHGKFTLPHESDNGTAQ